MKNLKRIPALILALILLASATLLCACSGGNANYCVTVIDGQGTPLTSGVIVKFMQDGTQVAMQSVDGNGVAKKELPKGNYTLELVFTGSEVSGYYDKDSAVLSTSQLSVTVKLMNSVGGEGKTIFATPPSGGEGKEYTAYDVTVGSTYIPLEANDRNYFLFTPTEAGTYQFSVSNNDYAIGYYGAPHFVQSLNAGNVTDNVLNISVSKSMIGDSTTGTSSYVIGVDGGSEAADCVLTITRTGDPEWNVSDEPWTEYQTTHTPAPFTLTLGADEKLVYADITGTTADNTVVYSETDDKYHWGSAEGPVVYVQLGKGAPYVALQTVIEGDGSAGGAPIRNYFYDADGKFLKKEDYTNILSDYFANMDPDLKIYPLTKDLEYIIQNGCSGWWTKDDPDFIFEGCNPEIGWMFALCYVG